MVALGRIDRPLVAVVQLCVEERRRLRGRPRPPRPRRSRPTQVSSRAGSRSLASQLDVGPLAVGMGGGRLAVHACHAALARPVHEEALGTREEVLAARRGQRHGLPRVADQHPPAARGSSPRGRGALPPGSRPRTRRRSRRPAAPDLCLVVDPPNVIRLPVRGPDRLAQDRRLIGLEQPEPHIRTVRGIHLSIFGSAGPPSSTGRALDL